MNKRSNFKSQASSSRASAGTGFSVFGSTSTNNTLSYLAEPANLSAITDPNVVVSFKNLSKKDGTTKTKGLDDLRAYVSVHPYSEGGGVEDPILEAWVNIYPRLSIDNSRRVRELSHLIFCDLLTSARKRMERHLPKLAGAWLAGLYDKDRTVAKAAQSILSSFFNTDTKVISFKKQCQSTILGYAQDAINETPETLSDERTMSADDRQEKYYRVVSSTLRLIITLLSSLEREDIAKQQDKYEALLLNNETVWSLVTSKDAYVRKSVCELLATCVQFQPMIIESSLELIGRNFIVKGLRAPQSTTASSLLSALAGLSSRFPQVWTYSYGRKGLLSLLRSFLERGPQSCNEQYWVALFKVLKQLPEDIVLPDIDSSELTLKALESGIISKDTISTHLELAWGCYADFADLLVSRLPQSMSRIKLCETTIYPLFERWFGQGIHLVSSAATIKSLRKLFDICASLEGEEANSSFTNEWHRLGEELVTSINTSLPEQSQGYKASQDSVTIKGQRWYQFVGAILRSGKKENAAFILAPSCKILLSAISSAESRDGKPYSAAATVEAGVKLVPGQFLAQSPEIMPKIDAFLQDSFPRMMLSPSAKYVLSIFQSSGEVGDRNRYRVLWEKTIDGILALPNGTPQYQALISLMSLKDDEQNSNSGEPTFASLISHAARRHAALQTFFLEKVPKVIQGHAELLSVLEQGLAFNALDTSSEEKVVEQATSNAVQNLSALTLLQVIFRTKPILLKSEEIRTVLVMQLLRVTELTPSNNDREIVLKNIIDSLSSGLGSDETRQNAVANAISIGLSSQTSLRVNTLAEHAKSVLLQTSEPSITAKLLPDLIVWAKELIPLLTKAPNPSLGLMRPFAGSVFLAKEAETNITKDLLYLICPSHLENRQVDLAAEPTVRDVHGFSMPLRMAMYTVRVFSDIRWMSILQRWQQETLLRLVAITTELASDQLDLLENSKLYMRNDNLDAVSLVRKFVVESKLFLNSIMLHANHWRNISKSNGQNETPTHDMSEVVNYLVMNLIQATDYRKPRVHGYYAARVLARVLEALYGMQYWTSDSGEQWLFTLGILKTTSPNALAAQSILIGVDSGLLNSAITKNYCNHLVSDLADAKPQSLGTLEKVMLLNSCIGLYKNNIPVSQNRIMFTVKNMVSWTPILIANSPGLASEVCHALQYLLPATKEIYGPQWVSVLEFCVSIWESSVNGSLSDSNIPMVGMSLKLYSVLLKIADPNDDLKEALVEYRDRLVHGLLTVLGLRRKEPTVPLTYIDTLLSRLLKALPPRPLLELSELYPLVASDFPLVQSSAYTLLSNGLSEAQQQISVDVLLERKNAQFPDELLSLLLEVPSVHDFSEAEIAGFPPAFRRYLFTWHLIFQSFATASNKVRNDYTESLKSGEYIGPFLLFLADVLGHSVGNPLDLGVAGIDAKLRRHYDMDVAIDTYSGEKSLHWLLSNLYCLALIYTPMLVKSWWTDCGSRQTKIAYESWTEKFFTPIAVEEHLEEVQRWADGQEVTDDEKELLVKTSTRARDIIAGYEIDDMTMQMSISLPVNYPLQPVVVTGINRVGIQEKKWKSFMITTQAVISFSNGSISEGLSTFRRNVISALKGHTECAICYSIISSDKKTPDKKCSTCSNLFHSKCLYTWFMSSSQSTCPLCRNPFNYGPGGR